MYIFVWRFNRVHGSTADAPASLRAPLVMCASACRLLCFFGLTAEAALPHAEEVASSSISSREGVNRHMANYI